MTQWYYSNAQRERLGPVSADDLTQLHRNGQLGADTLVWREGYADWKPWREAIDEVLPRAAAASPFEAAPTATPASAFATAGPNAPADADANPYRMAEPVSPYAPPKAQVAENDGFVSGGRVVYAGFWKRVAASFIDSFIATALSYMVQIPLMLVFGVGMAGLGGSGSDPFGTGMGIAMIGLIYVVAIGIPLLYFSWMHSSANQASLGKMAVGIKVVRTDGQRITFWRAFGRYFAYMLGGFTLGIGYVIAAFTDRKQAMHDMICDTLVVDKWAYTDHPEWQRDELGTVTIVILALAALAVFGIIALAGVMIAALAGSGIH